MAFKCGALNGIIMGSRYHSNEYREKHNFSRPLILNLTIRTWLVLCIQKANSTQHIEVSSISSQATKQPLSPPFKKKKLSLTYSLLPCRWFVCCVSVCFSSFLQHAAFHNFNSETAENRVRYVYRVWDGWQSVQCCIDKHTKQYK